MGMKKRIGILASAVLLFATACANVALPPDALKESTSQRLEDIASALPQTDDFRGTSLTILTEDESVVNGDENAAGSVREALRNRNELIRTSYGMEVTVKTVPEADILQTLQDARQAGLSAGDLLCYSAETTASLWADGLLQDLTKLPYFSLGESCFGADAAEKLRTGDAVYLLPDPSAQSYDDAYVLFYDRELVRATGLPLPEARVTDGDWTLAVFQQYAEAVAASVMHKQSYDLQTDVFGYSAKDSTGLLPYLLWCGTDDALFARKDGGKTDFVYDTAETLRERVDPLRTVYGSACRSPLDGDEAAKAFSEGRLGFLFAKLEEIKNFYANAKREYGILPLPKRDEKQQSYRCPIAVDGRVFSAPSAAADRSRCGLGLLAVCAAGGGLLQEAEVRTYVTLYSMDNDQTCMLETLLGCADFDFGWVYGTQERTVRGLSTELMTDVLVNGVSYPNALRPYLDGFRQYATENFS